MAGARHKKAWGVPESGRRKRWERGRSGTEHGSAARESAVGCNRLLGEDAFLVIRANPRETETSVVLGWVLEKQNIAPCREGSASLQST